MNLTEYKKGYDLRSKIHEKNVNKHGPQVVFGYPNMLPEQFLRLKFIVEQSEKPVLDVGCDTGYVLNCCGGGVGIDISFLRCCIAKRFFPDLNIVHAVAEYLPFKNECFNTVLLAELLEHVLDPTQVLEEAYKVLKNDGKTVITVPDEIDGLSHQNPEHLRKYTIGSLINDLTGVFGVVTEKYVEGHYPSWCLTVEK